MGITRRGFIERSGVLTLALAMRRGMAFAMSQGGHSTEVRYRTQFNARGLAQFVDPLPIPEVIKPSGARPSPENPSVQLPYYRVAMRQFEGKMHRDLKPTRQWGYGSTSPGPTFDARSGQGVLVEWVNELPEKHFLPIDHTIHGAEADKPEVRAVVHLHGAKAPPESDGYPENWYVPGKSAVAYYPNRQDAAMLWYHDHALGINRLNVFAGLFGVFFVRDAFEDGLHLPSGKYEVPLVLYDRIFDLESQLNYPISDDEKSPWTSEVFGDAIVVNGKIYPYLEVEPRKYRFRLVNTANGRFFHLKLGVEGASRNQPQPTMQQIGTDQGLLSAPVSLNRLIIGPGERADLVVDFSAHAGNNMFLVNDNENILQFRIAKDVAGKDDSVVPAALRPVPKTLESSAVKTRVLTLIEVDDRVGRPMKMLLNTAHWNMPVTENPALDSVEIWSLVNLTDDSHPIHLHLVKFQILDRRPHDVLQYFIKKGEIRYTGPATVPDPSEAGWKDTVRVDPNTVTRIIVKFEGYVGRYVWHCHLLEHEDNEMMRPFDVVKG